MSAASPTVTAPVPPEAPTPPSSSARRRVTATDVLLLIGALIVAVAMWALLRSMIAGLLFLEDEWEFVGVRRTTDLLSHLQPHNEHFVFVPSLVFLGAFEARGLASYSLLGAVSSAAHVATALMVLAVLRRWVRLPVAIAAGLCLLTFGWADEILLWPINLVFTLPVLGGLIAMVAWDTDEGNLVRDAAGAIALVVGVASGGAAMVLVGVAALILVSHRPSLARLVWVAVPVVVFGVWYLTIGRVATTEVGTAIDPTLIPSFVAQGLTTLSAPLVGLDHRYTPIAIVAISLFFGVGIGLTRITSARFWAPIAGIGAFYVLISLARLESYGVQGAAAPRYLYPSATLALIAAGVLVDRVIDVVPPRAGKVVLVGVVVWAIAVTAGGLGKLVRAAEDETAKADQIRAELATLQVLRPAIEGTPAETEPIHPPALGGMTSRGYFRAIDDLTPPVSGSLTRLRALPAETREGVDAMLGRLFGDSFRLVPGPAPTPSSTAIDGTLREHLDATVTTAGSCATIRASGPDPQLTLVPPPGSRLAIRTDGQRVLEVRGRAFSDQFGRHLVRGVLPEPGTWYQVQPAPLVDGVTWRVRLDPPPGSDRTEVCLVDG